MSKQKMRRQYLINKEFQIKFIVRVYLAVFISIIVVGVLLFFFNDSKLSSSAYQQVLSMKSARDMLLPTILSISAITAIVTLIVIIFRFLLESHRIAGPVYRFGKTFESLQFGDLTTRVNLRDKDEMHDLAENFNQMVGKLSIKIEKVKIITRHLQRIVHEEEEGAQEGVKSEELRKLINDLEDELATLKTS